MYSKKVISSLTFFLLSSSTAFAGAMGPAQSEQRTFKYFATLAAGPAWESAGETQTFFLAPSIEKTYTSNHSTHALGEGEVFLGIQHPVRNSWTGQIGLSVVATSNTRISGNIWDDASPEFNNFTYHYQVQHTHVALKGKLLAENGYIVTPWVSGSVGVGFNNAYRYNNTPIIFEAVQNPNFSSHTQTTFSYTVGAGVERAVSTHWRAGIGYEFESWGKSQLNRAPSQTLGNGLKLSNLYTNGFLLNITYLA
jgi:opacity protein-like surface antigen